MYKISIIIPVYNEENRLHISVDSVLNQKWNGNIEDDLEIILVDNCSTDNSREIMNQYSKLYSNIKIYSTEENIGVASIARNIGIKMSNSKYVMFLDADDEYCENMCQVLFDTITKKNVDVVTCNWYNVVESNIYEVKLDLDYDNLQYDDEYYIVDSLNAIMANEWMMWKTIYKKSFLINNNILFPPKVCEDTIFLIQVFLNMDKMIYIPTFYGYKRNFRNDSLSAISDVGKILDYLNAFFDVQELLESIIDFEDNKLDRFYFLRTQIYSNLYKIINLEKKDDMNICLDKLYELESKFQFDNSGPGGLYFTVIKIINFFILKNQRMLTIVLIRFYQIVLRIMNIFRKLKKSIL